MNFKKYVRYREGMPNFLFPFLIGFVLGVLLINFWNKEELLQIGILSQTSLEKLRYLEVDKANLFLYTFQNRMVMVGGLLLLSSTLFGVICVYAASLWLGFATGALLSAMLIRFGNQGIIMFLGGILPQYFCYIPACILLFRWCRKLCVKLYYPQKSIGNMYRNGVQEITYFIMQLGIILLILLLGIYLESYVNPMLIKWILRII